MNGLKWVNYMELFVEQKNKNYGVVYDIFLKIFDSSNKSISKDEIVNYIREKGNYTLFFEKSLLNKCEVERDNLNILKEISNNIYTTNFKTKVPPPILDIELNYLKSILQDERIRIFFNKETINKLNKLLIDYNKYNEEKYIEVQGISKSKQDYQKLNSTLFLVLRSRREKRLIKYTYITKQGQVFKDNYMIPYKIEYSIKHDKYYLIYYSMEQNRINKGIIENFTEAHISSSYKEYDLVFQRIPYLVDRQKVKEPIVLNIKGEDTVVKRAFYLFSCYEKEAYYNKEKDIYVISIYYYEYDEAEIISRILSLGKNAKVISPNNVKLQIRQRIKKAIENYEIY